MKKLLIIVGILFASFLALCLIGGILLSQVEPVSSRESVKPASGQQAQAPAPPKNPPEATMAEFQALQNGMSYKQACDIIGSKGELISSNHIDGVPGVMGPIDTVMYQWKGKGLGANMNATFQNDKLTTKAQFGLK